MVDGLAERLLRGEVLGRTHDHAGLRHRRRRPVQGAGDAEVHHLHGPVVGDDHVRRLDVAVHDAVLVGVGQRLQHTGDDDQRLLRAGRLRVDQQIPDGAALDQLHDDVRHGGAVHDVLAGVVDSHDRVVVETGHRLGLTREAGLGNGVFGEVGAEQLDRDRTTEAHVLGREHLGHTAPAESVGHPVSTVTDKPAVAPQLRRVRHAAASRLGVGRALRALLLCHQSSPSFLPAVRAVLVTVSVGHATAFTQEAGPGWPRDGFTTDSRWIRRLIGHETRSARTRASSVYRAYAPCNASATLLSRTVTDRAPRLTCQCPGADLAGNSTKDHQDRRGSP